MIETTVDHALMRGLVTAGPGSSWSCLGLVSSIDSCSADSTFAGSPTVTVPPALLSNGCVVVC